MISSEHMLDGGATVSSYFDAFAPAPNWDELVSWPPDVFALTNLVLDHTESYRFMVAPPSGRCWPPFLDWNAQVHASAREWRDVSDGRVGNIPSLVASCWKVVSRFRDAPLAEVRSGGAWDLVEALLTLHSTADEACSDIASSRSRARDGSFELLAWSLLQERGSLSRLSPTRVRIVPKTHFSARGFTIRSLSRYLALCYESVDVRCRGGEQRPRREGSDYNIVLMPWPLSLSARDFRPAPSQLLQNMDRDLYDFFEFAPGPSLDHELFDSVLESAANQAGTIDAVIFPEAAVSPEDIEPLGQTLDRHGATFLVAGVREPPTESAFGRNHLHFGVRTTTGWTAYEQDKHHRWCLDDGQIRQYHLARSLDPRKLWWEAIDIRERTLHVIDVGAGVTVAPMICEDLARLDESADVVRRVGPSLVVAVLLDGPQLRNRWPCRYASILADEPGSAVLTLTCCGMVLRSRPPGRRLSRAVAHWNSLTDGLHEIELAPRAAAIVLSTSIEGRTLWTADGRCHRDVPALSLKGIRQIRLGSRRRVSGALAAAPV